MRRGGLPVPAGDRLGCTPPFRPFLHPVPEGPDRAGRVRRENLAACAADLARRIQGGKAVR